jgi:hypothetical protein
MKAIETTGKIDDRGRLFLDRPLSLVNHSHVRIIVLVPEDTDIDPDDDPTETVLEGLQQGFHEGNYRTWGGDKEVYEIDCIRVAARIPC